MSRLIVQHTRDAFGAPSSTIANLPDHAAKMTPAQLYSLGQAIIAAALDCQSQAPKDRHFAAHTWGYQVADGTPLDDSKSVLISMPPVERRSTPRRAAA